MNKHPNWLCASVFASVMAALATIPAIAQSPAGTGGGAGGKSGSSSAMPAQQRNPILSREMRPRFREYIVRERRPSFAYPNQVIVGAELPSAGVTYYDIPEEYGVRGYRYHRERAAGAG